MIKNQILILISTFYKSFKSLIWKMTYSEKGTKNLQIIKGKKGKFYMFGDIVRILFSEQHLVSRKKSFEYDTLELFKDYLKPGITVLDIGANIGLFSVLGSEYVGDKGKIYAFEPTKTTHSFLVKNLELNNITNVEAHQIAFSNGEYDVVMAPPAENKKINSGDAYNQIKKIADSENSEHKIRTQLLDKFIKEKNIGNVDLIKIDIEGAELLCFQGGEEFLTKQSPVIIFECFESFCNSFDHSVFDVLAFLDKCGYSSKQLNYAQWIAHKK